MDQIKIGRFIAEQRKRLGLTQEQLAEALDVSNKTISRWERGINLPDYDQVLAVCSLFHVDIEDFLKGRAAPPSDEAQTGARSETR